MRQTFLPTLLLLLVATAAFAAPAPAPRAKAKRLTPQEMAGEWVMCWGATLAPTTLTRDGRYRCAFGDTCWVGTWSWTADGDLVVTEAPAADAAGPPLTWVARFERDGRGRLDRHELTGRVDYGGGLPLRLTRKR
jgi:hypothetical protein